MNLLLVIDDYMPGGNIKNDDLSRVICSLQAHARGGSIILFLREQNTGGNILCGAFLCVLAVGVCMGLLAYAYIDST